MQCDSQEYHAFTSTFVRTTAVAVTLHWTLHRLPASLFESQLDLVRPYRTCMVHFAQPLSPRRKYLTPSEIVQRKTTLAQLRGPDLRRGTMLAVVYTAVGPPSVLHVMTNFPKPIRAAGEVLVKVCLAGTHVPERNGGGGGPTMRTS